MPEYKPHENAVRHLKALLESAGALILENDNTRGQGGYRFPRCFNGVNDVEYTADVYAILSDGRAIGFEVDGMHSGGGHKSTAAHHKGNRRDFFFHLFGVPFVRYPTPWVKELTIVDVMRDVEYSFKQLRKQLAEEKARGLLHVFPEQQAQQQEKDISIAEMAG